MRRRRHRPIRRRRYYRRRRRVIKRPKITIRRRVKGPKITIRKLLGRGVSRPYADKRNRLMLGRGSRNKSTKQRGGFFSLGTALAAAPPIIDLLGKIIK